MDVKPGAKSNLRVVPPETARDGEPQLPLTLDEAFRRYAPYVARVCLRITGRPDDVDDLVQDVFLAAHRGLSSLRSPEAIKGWLATVAVRLARRRLRFQRMRAFLRLDDLETLPEMVDPSLSPADRALLGSLYPILRRLPVDQQLAWTLRHLEGEPLERVALLCGCSLATAKRRILAAQVTLQEALGHD